MAVSCHRAPRASGESPWDCPHNFLLPVLISRHVRAPGSFPGLLADLSLGLHMAGLETLYNNCPAWRPKNPETVTETSVGYCIGDLILLKQKVLEWHPLCVRWVGATRTFRTPGRRRLPFLAEIAVRLAHQLPGKPVAGARGKHVDSYWLSPVIRGLDSHVSEAGSGQAGDVQTAGRQPSWVAWPYVALDSYDA